MSDISEGRRRELIARADRDEAAARAEEARRRAAGEPPPVISLEKGKFHQGADGEMRPKPGGGARVYFATGPETRAIPKMPGDGDEWGNPTEQLWARRTFVAEMAGWLWSGQRGPEPKCPGDGTGVVLSDDGGVVITYPDGSRLWRDKQWRLHRTDGPAVERPDRLETWVAGERLDPPIDPNKWWDR